MKKLSYSLTLTEEQLDLIHKLLTPGVDTDNDTSNINADLCDQLIDLKSNTVAQNMYYINSYVQTQVYGGPEEGGWYYHTTRCDDSRGYYVQPPEEDTGMRWNHLLDEFINYTEATDILDKQHRTYDDILQCMTCDDAYSIFDLNAYGEGLILAIERAPGQSADVSDHHYC